MTVRTTMAHLIAQVRQMTNTKVGSAYAGLVTDSEVQRCLDDTRTLLSLYELSPVERIAPGGAITRVQWECPWGDWEDTVLLQSGSGWTALTPTVSDLMTGSWTLATSQTSSVYLSGVSYDRYEAAASVLDTVMASGELYTFNFGSGGEQFSRETIRRNYQEQAKTYRQMARPRITQIVRADDTGAG